MKIKSINPPSKFYHGTSKENWNKILKEGVLWGYNIHKNNDGTEYMGYRYTYLTPCIEIAHKFGDVVLEVKYTPVGINGNRIDNYCFENEIPEEEKRRGAICWQFSVFVPIPLKDVRKLSTFEVYLRKVIDYLLRKILYAHRHKANLFNI